jgi:Outer membrane lipoprotein-sorting protein
MSMSAPTANQLAESLFGRRMPRQALSGFRVSLCFLCLLCFWTAVPFCLSEDAPDAHQILNTVRINQAAKNRALRGSLRTAGRTIPFRLISSPGSIRYEFTDPPLTLQLRLGPKDSRLEEVTKGSVEKVTPARYDTRVRDTGITYEDLSLHFLYWQKATVEGEQTMVLQKCWIVRVEPDSSKDSQYSKVLLWVGETNGALMQAEAYDANGKVLRRFKVISGQKTKEGVWILKEMRIESMTGSDADRAKTYLEIEGVDN